MQLADALARRRMVRRFDPERPVSAASLDAVLDAALRAPSAGYTQAVTLQGLDREADRTRFWDVRTGPPSRWLDGMRTAPVLVLLWTDREAYLDRYAEPDKGWTDRDPDRWSAPYWFVDAGMAAMAALLKAVDLGLGACFFGVPVDRVDAVREAFGVPVDQLSVGVLALGHPAEGQRPSGSPTRRARRPRAERIRYGAWDEPGTGGEPAGADAPPRD